jgi:hypothetical protein
MNTVKNIIDVSEIRKQKKIFEESIRESLNDHLLTFIERTGCKISDIKLNVIDSTVVGIDMTKSYKVASVNIEIDIGL